MKLSHLKIILALCLFAFFSACGGASDDEASDNGINLDESAVEGSFDGTLDTSDTFLTSSSTYSDGIKITNIPADVTIEVYVESDDFDPIAALFNSNLNVLTQNDDSNENNSNSFISYHISEAGDYAIAVTSYDAYDTGNFTVTWSIY